MNGSFKMYDCDHEQTEKRVVKDGSQEKLCLKMISHFVCIGVIYQRRTN